MKAPFPIAFDYNIEPYTGTVTPLEDSTDLLHATKFKVDLNNNVSGIIQHIDDKWISSDIADPKLVMAIGNFIDKWIA